MNIVSQFLGCDRAPEGVFKCLQSKSTREIDNAANQVPGINTWTTTTPFVSLIRRSGMVDTDLLVPLQPPVVDDTFIPGEC